MMFLYQKNTRDISDNNLEKALELLLSNDKLNRDIDVDINVLTSALKDNTYESDKSKSIKESLNKYSDNKVLMKKHLKKHKEIINILNYYYKKIIQLQIQTLIQEQINCK